MKFFLLFTIFLNSVFAMEYYAKLQPIETYMIKAAVAGKVEYSNKEIEGKQTTKNELIIKLDSTVEEVDLKQSKMKLDTISKMIKLEQNNFQRISNISSKSAFEKDSQEIQVLNLKLQKSDLEIAMANLQFTLDNKKLLEKKDSYIYSISVKKGDYVSPGTMLYEVNDLSKGKLEIFIPISEYENVLQKDIYLDGTKSDLEIAKLYKVADAEHISSYKCEIHIPNPKTFSRLVKVEFK